MQTTRTEELMLPSRTVRHELPVRVFLFLRAISANPAIRQALEEGGYTEADHLEGSRLLQPLYGWDAGGLHGAADRKARRARERCEAFVSEHFPRLEAAIERLHPEHASLFSFRDAAARDPLVRLATWLDRLEVLEGSDVADVFETLARRGVDRATRRSLEQEHYDATAARPPVGHVPRRNRDAEVAALYRWHRDWGTTARTLIRRKDWLVALGLRDARRRSAGE
jgi:hypothetical protein